MKSSLKTVYIDKIKLLNKYSEYYYQKNNPLVTDQKFDNLKRLRFHSWSTFWFHKDSLNFSGLVYLICSSCFHSQFQMVEKTTFQGIADSLKKGGSDYW